tara:strand:- start:1095 stop:1718 length:624 start_codon:yes stop_codon:yes gene_type:complete
MSHFIKVCGITNSTDLSFITKTNIDAVGFNLYGKSKRHIELGDAKILSKYLPNSYQVFLIFVNQPAQFVSKCLKKIPNAIPQFHGEEDKEYCESFGANYVKAIRVKPNTDLEKINQEYKSAKMLIFDSFDENEYGGTGQTFDLKLIGDTVTIPYLVAGGIDASNFKEALLLKNCIGIDVCSSVEKEPGIKDHSKLINLIERVRSFHV